MPLLPGWDSVESTNWWSHFYFWVGIIFMIALIAAEAVSHIYGLRKDELVAVTERAVAEERAREIDAAENRRKAEVGALQKQLDAATAQLAEDHSLRNRVRRLFDTVDTNIVRMIDAGQLQLRIRMHPADIERLRQLLLENGGEEVGAIRGLGRRFGASDTINNGSLGPSGSGIPQIEVMFEASPSLVSKK
jgi:hypothetical protein